MTQDQKSVPVDPFTRPVEPDQRAPLLDRDVLKVPQIVQYRGPRRITYTKDGQEQHTTKHYFASQAGRGPWFSLWASADLDSQLRQLRTGALFKIRYVGNVDQGDGTTRHTFDVRTTTATPQQIDTLRNMPEWKDAELSLLNAIAQAKATEEHRRDERRQAAEARGEEPPPPDDEDQPPF